MVSVSSKNLFIVKEEESGEQMLVKFNKILFHTTEEMQCAKFKVEVFTRAHI